MKSIVVEVILRALFSLNTRDVSDYELRGGFNAQFFPYARRKYLFFTKEWSNKKIHTQKHKNTQTSLSSKDVLYTVVEKRF